jgi:hypothetical protein
VNPYTIPLLAVPAGLTLYASFRNHKWIRRGLLLALAAAAKKIPLCALVSSEGLGKKALHFDSADTRQLGQRYAAEHLKLAKP